MNRRKFIELLNLYIDGEINPEDVRRVEEKISRDGEARRVYDQYCRLHRGTRLLYERFRAQAPPEKVPNRDRTGILTRFPPLRPRRLTIAASGIAAAIILVSVSVLLMQPGSGGDTMEEIALTPAKGVGSAPVYAAAPVIQSFNSDTEIFELVPANDGTLVPAAWNPEINLRGEFLNQKAAPVAWPASSGIQWETPAQIIYPVRTPGRSDHSVYRSRGSAPFKISAHQLETFQSPK
jgi:anti-sigma factor RsiW